MFPSRRTVASMGIERAPKDQREDERENPKSLSHLQVLKRMLIVAEAFIVASTREGKLSMKNSRGASDSLVVNTAGTFRRIHRVIQSREFACLLKYFPTRGRHSRRRRETFDKNVIASGDGIPEFPVIFERETSYVTRITTAK